ncbi:diaminopimelate epimerase [Breznakia blatticola]|uniref:Diaminopimelate epimerase n=1 Tax=Breznakia blatticola TaxID=1754012 RepID=A0A4R7ZS69_9FIRM|nr:diaminopimelate epimerase [Breznakia blatticola]TDW20819.1 diaminopimelate epimerase [Breznakia blatticola]
MIPFCKYHGCGNSFVIVNQQDVKMYNYTTLAKKLCSKDIGIGADGLIIVATNPLEMIFYNQDGSQAPMCGNGIRCFSAYVLDQHLVDTDSFDVVTGAGILHVDSKYDTYEIAMGKPKFDHTLLHMETSIDLLSYRIDAYELASVFLGTIHTVMFVDDVDHYDVESVGKYICNHPTFQEKTNVNFVQVVDKRTLKVVTYERGVGITLACGTGCCASFAIASKKGYVDHCVDVQLQLGTLHLHDKDNEIMMRGPATFIAKGEVELKEEMAC